MWVDVLIFASQKAVCRSPDEAIKSFELTRFYFVSRECWWCNVIEAFPWQVFSHFPQQIALKPGSKSYGYWSSPPQPLYLDIYLFNWTNPKDFTNKTVKPNFEEIGPFRFQEIPRKVNVTFHDGNSTVSYRKQSRYFFVPEQSKGNLNDSITSINVIALVSIFAWDDASQPTHDEQPINASCESKWLNLQIHFPYQLFQSAANRAKGWGFLKMKSVSLGFTFYSQKVHVTKNASEWLFDGYEDPMINLAKDYTFLDAGDIPFDKFGWFYMVRIAFPLTPEDWID